VALDRELIDVPFSSGLNQKDDPRYLTTGEQAALINCRKLKNNAIRKRFGNSGLPSSPTGKAVHGGSYKGAPWMIFTNPTTAPAETQSLLWGYSDTETANDSGHNGYSLIAALPDAVALDRVGIMSWSLSPLDVDHCICNGYNFYVFVPNATALNVGICTGILDAATNEAVSPVSPWNVAAGACAPRIIACGTHVVMAYSLSGTLSIQWLDATNLGAGWSSATTITLINNGVYDIQPIDGDTAHFALAYEQNAGGALKIDIRNVTAPGTVQHTFSTETAQTNFSQIAIRATGAYIWAAYHALQCAGAMTAAGTTPPAVSLTGKPNPAANIRGISIGILVGGARGTATFEWFINGFAQGTLTTNATVALGSTGLTANFAVGTYHTDNIYQSLHNNVTRAAAINVGTLTAYAAVTIYSNIQWPGVPEPLGNVNSQYSYNPGRIVVGKVDSVTAQVLFSNDLGSDLPGQANGGNNGQGLSDAFVYGQMIADLIGAVSVEGSLNTSTGVTLYSRALETSGNNAYVMVALPSTNQGTFYLANVPWWANTAGGSVGLRWVGTFDPRLSKIPSTMVLNSGALSGMTPPTIANATGSIYGVPTLVNTGVTSNAVYEQRFDLNSYERFTNAELGDLQAFACGVPSSFGGQVAFELGFSSYPEPIAAVISSGGSVDTGAHSYIGLWEFYDEKGQLHQSSPGTPIIATTTGGNNTVTVTWPPLPMTAASFQNADSTPYLVVYRTAVNGTTYYRLGRLTSNNTYSDTAADATITSNALLPTTGGVLGSFTPPSARICILHKRRWWLAGCGEPTTIWPSTEFTPGTCSYFNEALNQQATGAVRALQSLDDKLIVFVQRTLSSYGVEYLTGEGPFNTGAQSDWTPTQPIPSDSGAVDQRATCAGPFGILYRSTVGGPNGTGGIFLLSRDLQTKYLSGPVEDLLSQFPTVTSMVVHPNSGHVYIYCVASDSSAGSGVRLVWDYIQGIWSEDLLLAPFNLGARTSWNALTSSGTILHHWATDAGQVYRESNGTGSYPYLDQLGALYLYVPSEAVSAHIKPSMSGFSRFWGVYVQEDSLDTHNLEMTLSYDYSPTYTETNTWQGSSMIAFDRFPIVDVKMVPGNQKAKAIQVTLIDGPGMTQSAAQGTRPPPITFSGAPTQFYKSITFTIPSGGPFLGMALFSWAIDGVAQDTNILMSNYPNGFVAGSTGITIFWNQDPTKFYHTDNVYTFTSGATGQGPSWAGFTVELGVKDRAYPNLPAAQK